MVRTSWMSVLAVAVVSLVLLVPAEVRADWVVASPPAVSYYYPAPSVTYYSPPVVSYYSPAVVYPTGPAVSYYYGSYYRPVYPVTSVGVTTYYGPFGRPRAIVIGR